MRIPTFFTIAAVGSATLAAFAHPVSAGYALMDDFEQPVGTSTWAGTILTDPTNAANRVAGGTNLGDALLPASIANGTTGTIFFRIDLQQNDAVLKGMSFNTTDLTPIQVGTGSFSQTMETSAYFGNAANANRLSTLTLATWYNVWAVIDNSADTARYYLTTGSQLPDVGTPLSVGGVSAFPFRASTSNPIITVAIDSTAYLDDAYVDPSGINLTIPTPEPATGAMMATAAFAVLRRRRLGR